MGLERLALFLNGHNSVWQTDELHELTVVGRRHARRRPRPLDGRRAALAAHRHRPPAGQPGDRRGRHLPVGVPAGLRAAQADPPRRAPRRAAEGHRPGACRVAVEATDHVSDVMGRRWPDVGPGEGGDLARETIEKESAKFSKTLQQGRRAPPGARRRVAACSTATWRSASPTPSATRSSCRPRRPSASG